ncbi:PD-(D/E)XK nuclease family protein [Vibrio caribbeanicus]|uniref:PD-(D/E)XK nuclease family protein n=1 Tax=Vibrio caribbeanicus TaxID=701175 RepID=UPI0030D9F062
MKTPNLFTFATSELSQDAFICWFISWADPACEQSDSSLHKCAIEFLCTIFKKHSHIPPVDISKIEVTKQDKNIDVLCVINQKYAILIEDKTWSKQHSDQLNRYKAEIISRGYDENNILPIYYKTEEQSDLSEVLQNGYALVLRSDILAILSQYTGKNDVLLNYREYLESRQQSIDSFKALPIIDWHWDSWIGFYQYLQTKLRSGKWDYVANPSGGFLGFWWSWNFEKDCDYYLQIEQEKLCFKIRVGDNLDKRKIRNYWHKLVIDCAVELGTKLTLSKPPRFGNGSFMTVCIASKDYRITDEHGLIDLVQTINMLKDAEKIIEYIATTRAAMITNKL